MRDQSKEVMNMSKRNIVHIEIPSSNDEESGRFYSELFGWKITQLKEMNYTMWESAELPAGGFSPVGTDATVGEVMIFVDSDDITSDLEKVKELGGEVVAPKMEIPGIGWYGIFKDLTGNKIALYTSLNLDFNK
jgi:uncharacterized protein